MADTMIAKTILFGVGGALVGGLHAALNFITDTKTELLLCTPYVHIQRDTLLLQVLSEIDEEFKEIDNVAAVRAIQAIDRLIGLRFELASKNHEPLMSDRVDGIVYFRKAQQAIQRFISHAEILKTPRRVIYLQRHTQTIMRQLDIHLQSVVMSTRDMYMHP
jgi:hypothetical protein